MSFSSGNGPVATAFVEVTANTRDAERQIDAFIKQLGLIDAAGARASRGLESSFIQALRSVDRQLRELGAPGIFSDVEAQAELAGENITDSFDEAQRQAEEQLREIGGAGIFVPLEAEAEEAGESVTNSFEEAQRQSDTQLRQIGGAGTFAPVIAESELAGEKIERSFNEASVSSRRSLSLISTAAKALGLAVGAVGVAAVGFGIKQAASLEQTKIGFEALLGSAEEADKFIKQMQQFAATTPFEFAGLANNARQLLAMGAAANISREDILPLLTTIGDLVSVLGQPPEAIDRVITALSQMASKGKVSSEELLQIGEAVPGFPIFQAMADGLGISTQALQDQLQAGSIPATKGIAALIEGMKKFPGAAGAMEKQATTLIGLLSTFKDTISIALVTAFDPLIPKVKSTLAEITPLLQTALTGIAPALTSITSTLLSGLVPVLATIGPPLAGFLADFAQGFSVLAHGLAPAIGTVANALSSLGPVMKILGLALQPITAAFAELLNVVLPPLITVFGQLVNAIGPVLTQIGSLATSFFRALAPAISALIEPLGEIADVFGDALLQVLKSLEPDIPALAEAFGELALAVAQLVIAFEPLLPIVVKVISLLAVGLAVALTQLAHTLATIINFIAKNKVAFAAVATVITVALVPAFIAWTIAAANAAVATLAATSPVLLLVAAVAAVAAALAFAFNHFKPFHDAVLALRDAAFSLWNDVLVPFAGFLASTFTAAVRGIVDFFTGPFVTAVHSVIDAVNTLWVVVLEPFVTFLLSVLEVALKVIAAVLLGPLFIAVFTVIAIFRELWHLVLEPLVNFLTAVFTPVIKSIASLFSVVFRTAVNVLKDAVLFLWNNVLVPFGNFLKSVFSAALGGAKMALNGVATAAGAVKDAIVKVWHSFIEPFLNFLKATATPAIHVFAAAFDAIRSAVGRVIDILKGFAKAIGGALKKVGDLAAKLKSIPGISELGDVIGKIDIPFAQQGGLVTKDTIAQLHSPEVIIPLNDPKRALQLAQNSGLFDLITNSKNVQALSGPTTGLASTGGSINIAALNVSFTGPISDAEAHDSANRFADALQTTLIERRLALTVRTI